MLTLVGLEGIPEVEPSDDLARLLADALTRSPAVPAEGDVVVVCQKVVSKAEGRLVRRDGIRPWLSRRAM